MRNLSFIDKLEMPGLLVCMSSKRYRKSAGEANRPADTPPHRRHAWFFAWSWRWGCLYTNVL